MTLFLALAISILACMIHAAVKRRWHLVEGGAPLLALTLLLTLVFAAA